jgi:hypothetical protein
MCVYTSGCEDEVDTNCKGLSLVRGAGCDKAFLFLGDLGDLGWSGLADGGTVLADCGTVLGDKGTVLSRQVQRPARSHKCQNCVYRASQWAIGALTLLCQEQLQRSTRLQTLSHLPSCLMQPYVPWQAWQRLVQVNTTIIQ